MNKKIGIAIIFLIILSLVGFFSLKTKAETVFTKDTTLSGNYTIALGKTVTLANNAKLRVLGNLTINGTLTCQNGALDLTIGGTLGGSGNIQCLLNEQTPTIVPGVALSLVAKHITLEKNFLLAVNGHIDMVSAATKLLGTKEAIESAYQETVNDAGGTARIGPFVPNNPTRNILSFASPQIDKEKSEGGMFINTAFAYEDGVPTVILRGSWHVGDGSILPSGLSVALPPKNIKHLLMHLDFGGNGTTLLEDLTLSGPAGQNGDDDVGEKCTARGKDGESGMRMRFNSDHILLHTVELQLGNGGDGGAAKTKPDCTPSIAQGGAGNDGGNFKMTAADDIEVLGLHIIPGKGGNGGDGEAFGKNGNAACPGEQGGNAEATGGKGAENKKELSATGKINGIEEIKVERVDGGGGGNAAATPGAGGDGTGCSCNGGKGGDGTAEGGAGGDAHVSIPLGTAEAHGGDAGILLVHGGRGGAGGQCTSAANGGEGGPGGNTKALKAEGGSGTTASGNASTIKDQEGGAGGKGGDGCVPGMGGKGGIGLPIGDNGKDGKNLCPLPNNSGTSPSGESTSLISAILYHGVYLPVDQLMIENAGACGERHWRAQKETVKATDASIVPDSIASCGFGKLSETPEMQVPAHAIMVN